jgi:hypothetical protein
VGIGTEGKKNGKRQERILGKDEKEWRRKDKE